MALNNKLKMFTILFSIYLIFDSPVKFPSNKTP